MMEQPNANRSWRPAASPDRPNPAHTPLVSPSSPFRPLSPAFLLRNAIPQNGATLAKSFVQMQNAIWPSSILYFPSSLVAASPRRASASLRFMSNLTPFCPLSNRPGTGLGARFSVSLNLNKIQVRQPSSTLKFFWGHRRAGISVQVSSAQAYTHCMDARASFLSSVAKAMEDRWAFLLFSRILCHTQSFATGEPGLAFGTAQRPPRMTDAYSNQLIIL
jgi:hypothetical protein